MTRKFTSLVLLGLVLLGVAVGAIAGLVVVASLLLHLLPFTAALVLLALLLVGVTTIAING